MKPETDRNVEAVIQKHRQRAEAGLRKYGVTTERGDLTLAEWMQHLQEELMDATVYIEAMKPVTPAAPSEANEPCRMPSLGADCHCPVCNAKRAALDKIRFDLAERAKHIDEKMRRLDRGSVVSQETMQMEFREPAPAAEPREYRRFEVDDSCCTAQNSEALARMAAAEPREYRRFEVDDSCCTAQNSEALARMAAVEPADQSVKALEFKLKTHSTLDSMNVPTCDGAPCRIASRLAWVDMTISRLRAELEQAQRRVEELQNKKCAHDAAREWSANTTPNFNEGGNGDGTSSVSN
jgi:hypothetical protein